MGLLFACVLVMLLPALGVGMRRGGLEGLLIAACIAAHPLLMRGYGNGGGNKNGNNTIIETRKHNDMRSLGTILWVRWLHW